MKNTNPSPDFTADLFNFEDAFDFGTPNLDLDFGEGFNQHRDIFEILNEDYDLLEPRFHKAKIQKHRKGFATARNARTLAEQIQFKAGDRIHCFVTGDFIFGDFIEAFMDLYDVTAKSLTISTLSLSEDNIEMLGSLLYSDRVQELNLIISYYFYANERSNMMPLIYTTLGQDNRFQLAVARTHAKVVLMETERGNKLVIHGSANLRSSDSIEQFTIEDDPDLYDFHDEAYKKIIETHKTIDKAVGGKHLREILKELGKETNE